MSRTRCLLFLLPILCSVLLLAQEAGETYEVVQNPYQKDHDYRVPDPLRPMVEIAGVRWKLVQVEVKGDEELVPGKMVSAVVNLEFENMNEQGVDILVILLLEDSNSRPLERLEISPFRAGSRRFKAERQKFKIDGEVLRATANIYLFGEVKF
jgi:hypothetical protein